MSANDRRISITEIRMGRAVGTPGNERMVSWGDSGNHPLVGGVEQECAERELLLSSSPSSQSVAAGARRRGRTARSGLDVPSDILMELAADAFLAVGSTRADRLQLDGLAARLLPECAARANGGHQKRRRCVQGAVLIAAGVEPEDTSWWPLDD